MSAQWPFLVALSATIVLPLQVRAEQQQSGCGTNPFQDWYFISYFMPNRQITGTIARSGTLVVGHEWDDGDWNFHVIPDEKSVLLNDRQRRNRDGEIELEVNSRSSPSNLMSHFPTGTRVEAYGEHVEDMGHDPDGGNDTDHKGGKTELHPLAWIRTLDRNPAVVFVAQDDTGRFVDTQNEIWTDLPFSLPLEPRVVSPWLGPASQTIVVREQGQLAKGTASVTPSDNGYTLTVNLHGWGFYNCENPQRVLYGQSPIYFATHTQSVAPLLVENIGYNVSTDNSTPNHQKVASITVTAQLTAPPGTTIATSTFRYESTAGVLGITEQTNTKAPHRVTFSMPYAPAYGYPQNTWRMTARASTQAGNQLSAQDEFAVPVDRTYLFENRVYTLPKAAISFSATEKNSGVCPGEVTLDLQEKLLPQIAMTSRKWYVGIKRELNGNVHATPTFQEVTQANAIDNAGFTARLTSNTHMEIDWKRNAPNTMVIESKAEAVSELGEETRTLKAFSATCGLGKYTYSEIVECSSRLVGQKTNGREIYKVIDKLSKQDKAWLAALRKYLDGKPLTATEQRLLIVRADEGCKIPKKGTRPGYVSIRH